METVAIPWAALIALGGAISSIIIALWAKIRSVEKDRDDKLKEKDDEIKEWTERWAREVKGDQWEENTDIRHRREELLEQKRHESERPQRERERERRKKEIDAIQRAYIDGESTPPGLKRK